MKKNTIHASRSLLPAIAILVALQPLAAQEASGRTAINGVTYYHETHGSGEPLLLLHGGLGSGDMFDPVLSELTKTRKVILVDLHGHGRTPLGNRPFSLEAMGNDMAALVAKLGYEQLDVMGYSLGGGVAFQMAVQHPARVRKLVLVSAGYSDKAFYPEMRPQQAVVGAGMAEMMKGTPMYESYVAVAPDPKEFPRLLDAVGDFMRKSYDYSADIPKLTMPVMLIFGDADMYQLDHVMDFYQKLGGGLRDAGWQREAISKNRLAIIPDATHYDIFMSPRLYSTALMFFEGKGDTQAWAAQKP